MYLTAHSSPGVSREHRDVVAPPVVPGFAAPNRNHVPGCGETRSTAAQHDRTQVDDLPAEVPGG